MRGVVRSRDVWSFGTFSWCRRLQCLKSYEKKHARLHDHINNYRRPKPQHSHQSSDHFMPCDSCSEPPFPRLLPCVQHSRIFALFPILFGEWLGTQESKDPHLPNSLYCNKLLCQSVWSYPIKPRQRDLIHRFMRPSFMVLNERGNNSSSSTCRLWLTSELKEIKRRRTRHELTA